MQHRTAIVGVIIGGLAAGCGQGTDEALRALDRRVAALERNAVVPVAPSASGQGDSGPAPADERLRADVADLRRRIEALEAIAATHRTDPSDFDAAIDPRAAAEARRERRLERRERLRALTAAYRDKLAAVRSQYRDDPANPERVRAMREVLDWYRTERRALLR